MPALGKPAEAFIFGTIAPHSVWSISVSGFDPQAERETESLLAIGNGMVGIRGSLEGRTYASQPGTLLAGIFNPFPSPSDPVASESAALVSGPDWLQLSIWVDDELLTIGRGETIESIRVLDMKQGASVRRWRQRLGSGRTVHLETLRAASFSERDVLIQRAWLALEGFGRSDSAQRPLEW